MKPISHIQMSVVSLATMLSMSSIVESHLSVLEFPKRSNEPVASNEVAGTNLLSKAEEQFPYLKGKNINVVVNPNSKIKGSLEFYDEEEEGVGDTPRPKEIPLGKIGIEIKNTNIRPIDVLGDYVSHYAVKHDPKLKPLYDEFIKSIPDRQQRDRYDYAVKNYGEKRPYEAWKERSGDPGMFRGYVFDQFPKEEFDKIYSPEQIELLNKAKDYLGIDNGEEKKEPIISQSDNISNTNNPTNLKTADTKGFRTFNSVEEGINASANQLYRYFEGQGPAKGKPTKTVKDVIALWRPETDRRGSKDISQANYEKIVADTIGVKPTDKININNKQILGKLIQGITKVEGNELPLNTILASIK